MAAAKVPAYNKPAYPITAAPAYKADYSPEYKTDYSTPAPAYNKASGSYPAKQTYDYVNNFNNTIKNRPK